MKNLLKKPLYVKVFPYMKSKGLTISSVDISARKKMDIHSGDTVRVWQKIKEGDKFRLQAFEGLVLARKHGTEAGATFTVRKVAEGVGVEKTFPLYSPNIDKVETIRRAKTRRAKLYYVREKAAKEIRRQMKNMRMTKEEVKEGAVVLEEKKEENK